MWDAIIIIILLCTFQHRAVITYAHYKSRKFNSQENDSPLKFHASAKKATVTDHDVDLSHKEYCNSEEISKDPDKPHAMLSIVLVWFRSDLNKKKSETEFSQKNITFCPVWHVTELCR